MNSSNHLYFRLYVEKEDGYFFSLKVLDNVFTDERVCQRKCKSLFVQVDKRARANAQAWNVIVQACVPFCHVTDKESNTIKLTDAQFALLRVMYSRNTKKSSICMKFAQNSGKYLYKSVKKQAFFSICSIVGKIRICYNFVGLKKRTMKNTYIRRS